MIVDTTKHYYTMPIHNNLTEQKNEHHVYLPRVTEAEQQQLAIWNNTEQNYPLHTCIPQLIAAQAAAHPAAIALVAGDRSLTYNELNQRANQLAHHLRMLGVRSGDLVGICVERSLDMVVGLLGILKAGGAYVPMDPSYPPERLAFIVEDTQMPILLTQEHVLTRISIQKTHVVCFDRDAALLSQQSIIDPPNSVTADDLAYVIYTSGSTGQPKGSLLQHKSLLNLIFWHQQTFHVTASDRATQVASPAFDATGWEVWPYLTCGACIYLPDEDTRITPTLMRDYLVQQNITISFLPTIIAESIMMLEWPTHTALRFLLTGADKLQHYPSSNLPFTLINNYGLTEAAVVNTSGPILPTDHPTDTPSIGRPIANTQIYLLDEQLREVPIGESGELYIGGAGLACGYLNRPELTAERFIQHSFADEPKRLLYKTGDLARFLPDGQIMFVGRADLQIKIRGYRIEPNEIVSALNQHPAIQASIVVAHEDRVGDKKLVAYVVPIPNANLSLSSLRGLVLAQLPDYMLPSTFVLMEELPLTAHGKVDRVALPIPDATNILHDDASMAPSTPTEIRVAGIVTTLLNIDEVGIDDNFFMLGGHSLLGTQVIARISETFGVDLALRTLFDSPTIRELSAEIERLIIGQLEAMSDEEAMQLLAAEQHI